MILMYRQFEQAAVIEVQLRDESVPISQNVDVILLCTNHQEYDSFDFKALGVPLVDCRNASTSRPAQYYAA